MHNMKINNTDNHKISGNSTFLSFTAKKLDTIHSNSADSNSVEISNGLMKLTSDAQSTVYLNSTKVDQIKAAISSGQFKINVDIVAQNLISVNQSLIGIDKETQ